MLYKVSVVIYVGGSAFVRFLRDIIMEKIAIVPFQVQRGSQTICGDVLILGCDSSCSFNGF